MKTLITAISLSLAMGVAGFANAEAFNDRGDDYLQTATSSQHRAAGQDDYSGGYSRGFVDQGEAWVAAMTHSGHRSTHCQVGQVVIHSVGFQEKNSFELDNDAYAGYDRAIAATSMNRGGQAC